MRGEGPEVFEPPVEQPGSVDCRGAADLRCLRNGYRLEFSLCGLGNVCSHPLCTRELQLQMDIPSLFKSVA